MCVGLGLGLGLGLGFEKVRKHQPLLSTKTRGDLVPGQGIIHVCEIEPLAAVEQPVTRCLVKLFLTRKRAVESKSLVPDTSTAFDLSTI